MEPEVDLLILQVLILADDLTEFSAVNLANAQLKYPDFIFFRKWIKEKKILTIEETTGLGSRMKELAQIRDQVLIWVHGLILKHAEDLEREPISDPQTL